MFFFFFFSSNKILVFATPPLTIYNRLLKCFHSGTILVKRVQKIWPELPVSTGDIWLKPKTHSVLKTLLQTISLTSPDKTPLSNQFELIYFEDHSSVAPTDHHIKHLVDDYAPMINHRVPSRAPTRLRESLEKWKLIVFSIRTATHRRTLAPSSSLFFSHAEMSLDRFNRLFYCSSLTYGPLVAPPEVHGRDWPQPPSRKGSRLPQQILNRFGDTPDKYSKRKVTAASEGLGALLSSRRPTLFSRFISPNTMRFWASSPWPEYVEWCVFDVCAPANGLTDNTTDL
jgi:hypothetical protein